MRGTQTRTVAVVLAVGVFWALLPAVAAQSGDAAPPETVTEMVEGMPVAEGELATAEGMDADTSEPLETPTPFTAVAFVLPSGDEEVRLRTSADGQTWSDWDYAPTLDAADGPDPDSAELRGATDLTRVTDLVWVGEARWLQVTVLDGSVADLEVHLIDSMGLSERWVERTARTLGDRWRGSPGPDVAHASVGAASVARPPIVSRSTWGANEGDSGSPSYASSITHAVVHHTAGSNSYSASQAPGVVRAIQAYHIGTLGWSDIGYNFLVDRYGTIYEGRNGGIERAVIGAHAGGWNTGSFGVSLMGNFEESRPPATAVDALTRLVGWKAGLHGLDPDSRVTITGGCNNCSSRYAAGTTVTVPAVFGHRDTNATACPGRYVAERMGEIRRTAAALADGLPFADIARSVHRDSITRLHELGVSPGGCGDGNFCPGRETTRGQMASFIVRASSALSPLSGARFIDVPVDSVHASSINALVDAGITVGCDDERFCPGATITRAQLASMLVAATDGLSPAQGTPFGDVGDDHPHAGAIAALHGAGVISGCGAGDYCPTASVTREQMATFLVKAIDVGL